jgi:hypothetical protein
VLAIGSGQLVGGALCAGNATGVLAYYVDSANARVGVLYANDTVGTLCAGAAHIQETMLSVDQLRQTKSYTKLFFVLGCAGVDAIYFSVALRRPARALSFPPSLHCMHYNCRAAVSWRR